MAAMRDCREPLNEGGSIRQHSRRRKGIGVVWNQLEVKTMKIPWKEVCKFLAGAFFVSSGVLFYLYLTGVSVPFFGYMIPPIVHGMRAIVHFLLFLTFFYLGFIRKERL